VAAETTSGVHGKVNRLALPTPDRGVTAAESYAAPRTPLEELVTGIWIDILGLPNIGIRDDFFALGGHSLLATQVISRLQHTLGINLTLRAFFEAPTIAQLARAVEEALVTRVEKMGASTVTDLLKASAYDDDD
jgi:acyl carrier protein